ncbi:MAG: MFS transporter [Chloroflexota bacterium]
MSGTSISPSPRSRAAARGDRRSSFMAIVLFAMLVNGLVLAVRLVASYRALALDADALALGIVASAFALLSVVAAVPVGRLVDRFGEPLFLTIGALLLAAGSALTVLAGSIALLAASQALLGLGQLTAVVASQTLVGRRGDRETRSAQFGIYAAFASVGQLVGPLVGAAVVTGLAAGGGPAQGLVTFCGVAFAAAALGGRLMVAERGRGPRALEGGFLAAKVPASTILRWPGMGRTMVVSMTLNLGVDTLVVFLPAYGEATGIPVETVGALLALRSLVSIGARAVTGPVVRRLGEPRTLLLSIVVAAVAFATIPLSTSTAVLALQMVGLGLGLGLGQPLTLAWVAATSPPAAMGTAVAVRLTGNRVAQLVAPAALGLLAGPAGVAAVFLALGGLLGASGGMLWRWPLPRDVTG